MEVGDAAKGKDPDYGARNRGVSKSMAVMAAILCWKPTKICIG